MKSPTRRHAKRIIRSDKRHRETLALFGIVSMLVVACVAFAFRLNGRAQTHEVQVLECPVTGTVAHHHDGSCYDDNGNLICTLPEIDAHVHTDACYDEQTTLVCGLDETPAHYHDESCYDEEGNLICGLDETPGHMHSDACYKTTRTLVCGQQETTEHVHGPGCFKTYEVSDTMPAQTFEHVFTDKHDRQVLKVFVDAPEDALPDGVTMEAKWVSAKKLDTDLVEKAIAKKTDGKMLDFQAVDITFYDVTGAEIEPKKDVTVTFTSDLIDTDDELFVVHVESEKEAIARGEAQGKSEVEIEADVVDQLSEKELKKRDVKLSDDELAFDSDQFSTYVLAVTSLQKKMKATDDSTVTVVVSAPAEAGIPQDASLQVTEIASNTDEYADYQTRATQAMGTPDAQVAVARFFDITIVDGEGKAIQPQAPVTVKTKLTDAADLDDAKTEAAVVHFGEQDELMDAKEANGVSTFKTDGFSVYGFVYTVDFHYEVDGQAYEYNLAGGDVVTLSELLQAMGTLTPDAQSEAEDQEPAEETTDEPAGQPTAIDLSDPTDLKLFIQQIDNVQFSDESLLAVAHFLQDTTAGELKQLLGVEPEYSAELTDEQIEQMDARQLAAPDWALVSLKPFDTEELLTITMKDGQVFTVKITDQRNNNWEVWFDGTLGQSGQSDKFYDGATCTYTQPTNGKVTLPTDVQVDHPNKYEYELRGWYDVSGKQWYEPGTSVPITKDTVFYADWRPKTYSRGSEAGTVTDTPDVSGFVTTEIFDYNELVNANYASARVNVQRPNPNYGQESYHSETWTATSDFAFISWNYNWRPQNSIGMPGNLHDASTYHAWNLSTGIYGSSANQIQKLFETGNYDPQTMVGKEYIGTGDHLFRYNEQTGEYYYDSGINAATYDQSKSRFYVYEKSKGMEGLVNDSGQTLSNFFPYNDYPGQNAPQQNTGATNYWFGMKNTIKFSLPDDVSTHTGNKINGEDMVFKFSGDDDVWVFVDGQLVLDLGGIHNRAGGYIDFSTGKVTTFFGTIDDYKNETTHDKPKTVDSPALNNLKAGNHTLEVLYLERGSSFSNCAIYFNLIPQPKSLTVAKRLAGLGEEDLKKYSDELFTYEILVKGKDDDEPHLYNTAKNPKDSQKAIYKKQDGSTELIVIQNGQVTLKAGETVTIPDLDRYDSVYVAEEKGLNMEQFETPHAERTWVDANEVAHEKELTDELTQSTSEYDHKTTDWKTPVIELMDKDVITFTNTLKERELEVEKVWDEETVKSHDPVYFTVEATADGEPVSIAALQDANGRPKQFELSDANSWKNIIYQLPVKTSGDNEGKEITYTVKESEVDGYASKAVQKELTKCDIDVVKLWPDGNAGHTEVIPVRLKSGSQYYTGTDGSGNPTFGTKDQAKVLELKPENGYEQRYMDLPASGTYEAEQASDADTNTEGISYFRRDIFEWTITNTPEKPGKIQVQKRWLDSTGQDLAEHPQEIQYTVYQYAHEHEWGYWEGDTWHEGEWCNDVKATPTQEGHWYQECKYNKDHKNEWTESRIPHEHEWVTTEHKDPTCTEQGWDDQKCKICETEVRRVYIEPKGHAFPETPTSRVEPDCTNPGYEEYVCANDATHVEIKTIPAKGHTWSEWVERQPKAGESTEYKYYTRRCEVCDATDEMSVEKPKNVYPGTEIPLDSIIEWPTEQTYPRDRSEDPCQTTQIVIDPTGIFKYGNDYYVVHKQLSNVANQFYGGPDGFIPTYIVKIQNQMTPQNFNTSDIKTGTLYIADNGVAYVFTSNDTNNITGTPDKGHQTDRWRIVYDPRTNNSNGVNAALTNNPTSNKMSLKSALKALLGANDASGADDDRSPVGRQTTVTTTTPTVTVTDLTEAQLMEDLGVKELGKKDETTGNVLREYTSDGGTVTRVLPTVDGGTNRGSDDNGAYWASDWISVPLHDPDHKDVTYAYYVVETNPAGNDSAWETTYAGQEDGLTDNGVVTITNKQKVLTADINVVKVDEKGNPLPGVKFTVLIEDGNEYQAIMGIKNNDAEQTPRYPDVTGLDANSQFVTGEQATVLGKLPDGNYKLVEESTVDGYIISQKEIAFSIENNKLTGQNVAGVVDINGETLTIRVTNKPGAELPKAGGPGPMLINILGATLISAAIFTYVLCGKRQYAYARATSGRRPARRGTPRRDSRR